MIGYNTENGATCYFESPDAIGDNIQSEYLSYDETGFLDGTLPSYGTSEFDQLFISFKLSKIINILIFNLFFEASNSFHYFKNFLI